MEPWTKTNSIKNEIIYERGNKVESVENKWNDYFKCFKNKFRKHNDIFLRKVVNVFDINNNDIKSKKVDNKNKDYRESNIRNLY